MTVDSFDPRAMNSAVTAAQVAARRARRAAARRKVCPQREPNYPRWGARPPRDRIVC